MTRHDTTIDDIQPNKIGHDVTRRNTIRHDQMRLDTMQNSTTRHEIKRRDKIWHDNTTTTTTRHNIIQSSPIQRAVSEWRTTRRNQVDLYDYYYTMFDMVCMSNIMLQWPSEMSCERIITSKLWASYDRLRRWSIASPELGLRFLQGQKTYRLRASEQTWIREWMNGGGSALVLYSIR